MDIFYTKQYIKGKNEIEPLQKGGNCERSWSLWIGRLEGGSKWSHACECLVELQKLKLPLNSPTLEIDFTIITLHISNKTSLDHQPTLI